MSIGMVRYEHRCGGILKEVSLKDTRTQGKQCPKCELSRSGKFLKGCCEHHSQLVKVTEKAQKTLQYDFSQQTLNGILSERLFFIAYYFSVTSNQHPTIFRNVRTFTFKTPIYIFHCVFRI